MNEHDLDAKLNDIQAILKQKGYRLTHSRQKIVQALLSCGGHITAVVKAVKLKT